MPSKTNSRPKAAKKTAKPVTKPVAKKAVKKAPAKKAVPKKTVKPAAKKAPEKAAPADEPKVGGPTIQVERTPAPEPAPKTEPAAKVEQITTTSQLEAHLDSLDIDAPLASPPRKFVAVLTNEANGNTVSEIFLVTEHRESPSEAVLTKLFSKLMGTAINRAELKTSSLQFFIDIEMDGKDKEMIAIEGKSIRLRRRAGQNWENVPDSIRVQLFRNDPHVIDDDAETLAINKQIAREAIEEAGKENRETAGDLGKGLLGLAAHGMALSRLKRAL